jgi:hypothetical protein
MGGDKVDRLVPKRIQSRFRWKRSTLDEAVYRYWISMASP